VKDEKTDGKTLLLGELFRLGVKQGREDAEREPDEFRRRLRVQETD
jgi:hypothetical protein